MSASLVGSEMCIRDRRRWQPRTCRPPNSTRNSSSPQTCQRPWLATEDEAMESGCTVVQKLKGKGGKR
eukprot:60067-Alexandrium_andersonii.AAC.1